MVEINNWARENSLDGVESAGWWGGLRCHQSLIRGWFCPRTIPVPVVWYLQGRCFTCGGGLNLKNWHSFSLWWRGSADIHPPCKDHAWGYTRTCKNSYQWTVCIKSEIPFSGVGAKNPAITQPFPPPTETEKKAKMSWTYGGRKVWRNSTHFNYLGFYDTVGCWWF